MLQLWCEQRPGMAWLQTFPSLTCSGIPDVITRISFVKFSFCQKYKRAHGDSPPGLGYMKHLVAHHLLRNWITSLAKCQHTGWCRNSAGPCCMPSEAAA
eukprot:363759-Chlamydomonas_euryale.AAC.23